jgi:formylglycine-generating enzyme required for sulfatase activity
VARGVVLAEEKKRAAEAEVERQRQADAAFLAKYGITRPRWASRVDTDQYGLWADLAVGGVTQRLRWIKPGNFVMGSPPDETDRQANEAQHTVQLTRGFWLGDSECTQGLWQAVMGANPSKWSDASRPVEQVSWDDCQSFMTKLNVQARGLGARLPTEAEWEYACRAGTTTAFAFGADITATQVNFDGNYPLLSGAAKSVFRQQTVSVKQFPANTWGLHDMHGNVWEWCSDWYTESLPLGVVSDPIGPASGSNRVFRGGSWLSYARYCRSAGRIRDEPGFRYYFLGFRLCAQSTP